MKRIGFFVLLLVAKCAQLEAQVSFQKRIDIGRWTHACSLGEMPDGGFLITGVSSADSLGRSGINPYAFRLSPDGSVQWVRSFSMTGNTSLRSVLYSNGSLLMIIPQGFEPSAVIVKCDSSGSVQWSKNYIGPADHIAGTQNGGFVIAGTQSSDGTLVSALDSGGNLIWSEWCNITNDTGTLISGLVQTADGGFVIAAKDHAKGATILVKISAQGKLAWAKYLSTGNQIYLPESLLLSSDNELVISGGITTDSAGRDTDISIVKFSDSGSLLWSKEIGLARNALATTITETNDGDLVFAGYTSSHFGSPEMANDSIIMADITQGGIVKYAAILGLSGMSASASGAARTTGNTFALLGNISQSSGTDTTINSIFIAKHLANSNDNCNLKIVPFSMKDIGSVIDTTLSIQSGTPTLSINATSSQKQMGYISQDLCANSSAAQIFPSIPLTLSLSPNPIIINEPLIVYNYFRAGIYDIRIIDLLGNIRMKEKLNIAEMKNISLDVSHLAAGIFIFEMQKENEPEKIYRAKFVKE